MSRTRHARADILSLGLIAAVLGIGFWLLTRGVNEHIHAIMGSGNIALGDKLAQRMTTALRSGDDGEFGGPDDPISAVRFRKTRLALQSELGPLRSASFLDMQELTLGERGGPESVSRATFLVRGERGRRTVELARARNVSEGRWRITGFAIVPSRTGAPKAPATVRPTSR